jgi:hypothetical protein
LFPRLALFDILIGLIEPFTLLLRHFNLIIEIRVFIVNICDLVSPMLNVHWWFV